MQETIETSEMLDLKSEVAVLKKKILETGREKSTEITQKNLQISKLERKLKEETEKKEATIHELEKDIEITLQSQIQENEKLKS